MNKMKKWLIVAPVLILAGCLIFGGVMMALNWDFSKLSTVRYVTTEHKITEDFGSISGNISITADTADITFAKSDDGTCKVVCFENEKAKHTVTVTENTLNIKLEDQRTWKDRIGFSFRTPTITVYLPLEVCGSLCITGSTGDITIPKNFLFTDVDISLSTGDVEFDGWVTNLLKIKTSTGDIDAENIHAGALDLTVSTGEIELSHVTCAGDVNIRVTTGKTELENVKCVNLLTTGDTGDLSMENVVASGKFTISRSTGDVTFDGCDAEEIFVETDTGNVTGSLLTDKIYIAKTDTGNVIVPSATQGGKCEITTDTGDIKIRIQ